MIVSNSVGSLEGSWKRLATTVGLFLMMTLCSVLPYAQMPPTGPHIYLQDPQDVSVTYTGPTGAASALASSQATPVSLASGDFYQDGIASLAAGYSFSGGGVLAIYRDNIDAFAPQTQQSWQAISQSQFPAPFLSTVTALQIPASPDFLAAGKFLGTDHLDLITAARGTNTLYALAGDGRGSFAAPQIIGLSGPITAMADGEFGSHNRFSALLVGVAAPQPALLFYRGSSQGLSLVGTYALPAPATALALADLDGDSSPDAAILAGGHVLILHAGLGTASASLEQLALPLSSSASAIALGSFVHDRAWRNQMAILGSDGTVSIVVHGGFDPRPWAQSELLAMRQAVLQKKANPYARPAFTAVNDGWTILETFSGLSPFTDNVHPPLIYRSAIFDHGTHDIMVLNRETAQMSFISHSNLLPGATTFVPGQVSTRSYTAGSPIAGVPMRVNVDGRLGLAVLHQNKVAAAVMMPLPDPTFTVNTTDDTPDANPGDGICADSKGMCSLRAAVMEANALNGSDTIMLPAGNFALTIPSNGQNDASTGHLQITDGITIVGQGPAQTIIVGEAGVAPFDKAFTIGLSTGTTPTSLPGFDTSFSNLTIQCGAAPSTNPVGGAFDWDAGSLGNGTLTLTNVNISSNTATDTTAPKSDDGGGIFLSSEGSTATTVMISGGAFSNNTAADGGGAISVIGPISLTLSKVQLSTNHATGGGAQTGGGLASFFATAAGSVQIDGGTINKNTAGASGTGNGAGIWSQQPLILDQSLLLQDNIGGNAGGALWADITNGAVAVSTATFTGNGAGGVGGGIHVEGSGTNPFNLSFSRLFGNNAPTGSGLDTTAGTVTATDNWWGCNEGPQAAGTAKTPFKIFNTGLNSSGGLASDGAADIHYTLIASGDPSAPGTTAFVANASGSPISPNGPWAANGPNSKWISPLANANTGLNPGTYIYQTTFDLTGLDPATAQLTGSVGADDSVAILLNGQSINNFSGFSTLSGFTITNGFIRGINTLDFVVGNGLTSVNPTGFRVEFSSATANTLTNSCDLLSGSASFSPFVTVGVSASPNPVTDGSAATLTASFQDSNSNFVNNLGAFNSVPVAFTNAVNGNLSAAASATSSNGTATATLTPVVGTTTGGPIARADVQIDKATVTATAPVSDFSLTGSPASLTINVGTSSAIFQIGVAGINSFVGTVNLSITSSSGLTATLGAANIPSSGSTLLTVTTTSVAPGTYPLTMTGTSGGISHKITVQLTVADFGITAVSNSVGAFFPSSGVFNIVVSSSTGFDGLINLSTTGLPSNVSASFSKPVINLSSSVTTDNSALTVTAPVGSYSFNVQGTSQNGVVRSIALTLTVSPAPDFSFSVSPTSQSVTQGNSASYTATLTSTTSTCFFSGPMGLSATGLPAGTSTSTTGGNGGPWGSNTLVVTTSSSTPYGTYTLNITATGCGTSHSTNVTLTVNGPPPPPGGGGGGGGCASVPSSSTSTSGSTASNNGNQGTAKLSGSNGTQPLFKCTM